MLPIKQDDSFENVKEKFQKLKNAGQRKSLKNHKMICQYNIYMCGVDVVDHYATTKHSHEKFQNGKPFFVCLLDVCINNAFLLLKSATT